MIQRKIMLSMEKKNLFIKKASLEFSTSFKPLWWFKSVFILKNKYDNNKTTILKTYKTSLSKCLGSCSRCLLMGPFHGKCVGAIIKWLEDSRSVQQIHFEHLLDARPCAKHLLIQYRDNKDLAPGLRQFLVYQSHSLTCQQLQHGEGTGAFDIHAAIPELSF